MTRLAALCLTLAILALPDLGLPLQTDPQAGPCDPAIQKCW